MSALIVDTMHVRACCAV